MSAGVKSHKASKARRQSEKRASEESVVKFRPKVKKGGLASRWVQAAQGASPEKNLRTPGVRESQDLEELDPRAIQAAQ